MTRLSFNILGQFLTAQQWQDCLDFMRLYRPTTVGVMDHVQRAYELMSATEGETIVWLRQWRPDDAYLWRYTKPKDFVDEITHGGNISRDLWLYVLNEPDTNPNTLPELMHWLVEVGDRLADDKRHAIMGNIGPATVQPETIDSGVFDTYLHRQKIWPHLDGRHEYTGILLPLGVGYWPVDYLLHPENIQPGQWPEIDPAVIETLIAAYSQKKAVEQRLREPGLSDEERIRLQIQIAVPPGEKHYWHLLRTEWFQARAVTIGAGRFQCVLTEFGWDRMPDLTAAMPNIYQQLEAKYGVPERYSEIKGIRTLEKVYAAYFPDWTFERAIFEQLAWADRNYPAEYLGFNLFAWVFDKHLKKDQNWE